MQVFETIKKIQNWNWKKIENIFVFTGVIFFMMSLFNLYAVEEIKVDMLDVYNGTCVSTAATTGDSNPNKDCDKKADLYAVFGEIGQAGVGLKYYVIHDEVAYDSLSPLQKNGLVGSVSNAIAAIYREQPRVDLVAHLGSEWVPGYDSTSYATFAADTGYESLIDSGVDGLWNTTRNLAYIAFVIVLIIAGFMIMFRQKIGGQLAVSVFNVIPRVIMNLVLVTFSFAIVGLVIDISALMVRVVGGLLTADFDYTLITPKGPFALFQVFMNTGDYFSSITSDILSGTDALTGTAITGIVGLIGGVIAGGLISGLVLLAIPIVVAAIIGWASIKVYITLLKAYIGILIDTVMGPLYIAISTLPGSNQTGEWFRRLLKNALTFPLVFLFINLGMYLVLSGADVSFPDGLTGGDLSTSPSDPTFLGVLLKASLVIVMFFIAAEAPKFLEDILPSAGGKGAAAALEGARDGFKKVPLVGGLLG